MRGVQCDIMCDSHEIKFEVGNTVSAATRREGRSAPRCGKHKQKTGLAHN